MKKYAITGWETQKGKLIPRSVTFYSRFEKIDDIYEEGKKILLKKVSPDPIVAMYGIILFEPREPMAAVDITKMEIIVRFIPN